MPAELNGVKGRFHYKRILLGLQTDRVSINFVSFIDLLVSERPCKFVDFRVHIYESSHWEKHINFAWACLTNFLAIYSSIRPFHVPNANDALTFAIFVPVVPSRRRCS